ncbi:unnamed protein product [Candidula unifasciata]|uniref:SAM domain-containing protein n=1 Tax=Candidula unifasciata TaxID=100452 RepID=A0A8S3ZC34_9EUPU|nr:unnamed protein product [Candidula unifasciata]
MSCGQTSMNQCPETRCTSWPVTTNWTVRDVGRYVHDLGYTKYFRCFTENAITGKDLETMDAFDLQRESGGNLRLPPLADVNNLRLPYRDHGDRIYRYKLPVQSYHDHCMVLGRVDVWKMYNSKF